MINNLENLVYSEASFSRSYLNSTISKPFLNPFRISLQSRLIFCHCIRRLHLDKHFQSLHSSIRIIKWAGEKGSEGGKMTDRRPAAKLIADCGRLGFTYPMFSCSSIHGFVLSKKKPFQFNYNLLFTKNLEKITRFVYQDTGTREGFFCIILSCMSSVVIP